METRVERFIKEYENKINLLDHEIQNCNQQIKLRRSDEDRTEFDEWLNERAIANSKRQNYVQFIVDLKTL